VVSALSMISEHMNSCESRYSLRLCHFAGNHLFSRKAARWRIRIGAKAGKVLRFEIYGPSGHW
jgi:hypothetical protein